MYPHPFPDFELEPAKWLGASFGVGELPGGVDGVPLVGFVIEDPDYAAKLYNLVLSWIGEKHIEDAGGMKADKEKCIRVAVVEDTESSYLFFCHPNFDHPAAKQFYKAAEASGAEDGVVTEDEAIMLILGRRFDIGSGANSRYRWFRDQYREGIPVALEFLIPNSDGSLELAEGTVPIVVFDMIMCTAGDLPDNDPLHDLVNSGGPAGDLTEYKYKVN